MRSYVGAAAIINIIIINDGPYFKIEYVIVYRTRLESKQHIKLSIVLECEQYAHNGRYIFETRARILNGLKLYFELNLEFNVSA